VLGCDNAEHTVPNPNRPDGLWGSGDAILLSTSQIAAAAGCAAHNPWYSYQLVRIYDIATEHGGAPVADIGPVTILPDPNQPLPGQIRILVAPPFFQSDGTGQSDFPSSPLTPMLYPGARSFRSLSTASCVGGGCAGVRCSIYVTRDIGSESASPRDRIEVAQAYRLQAAGEQDGSGNVYADVTASMNSGDFRLGAFPSFRAIGYVFAGQSIQGTLNASGDAVDTDDFDLFNSIGKVVVGPAAVQTPGTVFGIAGDLLAERGRIGSVLCAGPIGTPDHSSKIFAGNGIDEVRVVTNPDSGLGSTFDPAAFDIHADVETDHQYTATRGENSDAPLGTVQTGGNFVGSIRAANIPEPLGLVLSGVLVRGSVDAPITVTYDAGHVSIIASTFYQPISIGLRSAADVVATDPAVGEIPSIEIGYATGTIPDAYFGVGRGMAPINCAPIPPTLNPLSDPTYSYDIDHFDADDWLNPNSDPTAGFCLENGSADSLIRAKHIGVCRVASMQPTFSGYVKSYMPRIEAEHIDALTIDDMASGIVWSGNLEYSGGVLANDASNDYATIDAMTIGTVGPYSRLWFQGCPLAEFSGNIYGELRLPELAAGETVRVGGGLLDWTDCLNPGDATYPEPSGSIAIPQPRGTSCSDRGKVRIDQAQGLHGQIILNASNGDPTNLWEGDVVVGTTSPVTIAQNSAHHPSQVQPDLAPFYERTSVDLGGGAIGLNPYHLYGTDSFPKNYTLTPATPPAPAVTVVSTDFNVNNTNDAHPVNIRFYGPIFKSSGTWNSKVRVDCIPLSLANSACSAASWQNVTGLVLVRGPGDADWTDARALGISRANSSMIVGPGIYRVTFIGVKCGGLTVPAGEAPLVGVGDLCPDDAYYFRVGQDCPVNDGGTMVEPDHIDDTVESGLNFACPSGCGDVNGAGGITVQDIFDYLNAWFALCGPNSCDPATCDHCTCNPQGVSGWCINADFNHDHSISVQDIFDFLNAWFVGPAGCQ
jgi:hypothetical protein